MVTQQAPLVDVTSSQVAGNIDRRQMAELPLQGRNWQELSLMVKGVTANNVTNTPGRQRRPVPTQPRWPADHAASGGLGVRPAQDQPGGDRRVPDRDEHVRHHAGPLDRDAGAGDLPLGHQRPARRRPMGSSATTASTPPTRSPNKVLPFQNQQVGGTLGGPIIQNKMHFFGVLRVRAAAGHGVPAADAAAAPDLPVRDEADQQELSRPGRLSTLVHGHLHGPRPALGVRQPVRDRERHGASVDGRTAHGSVRPTSSAPGRMSWAPT